MYHEFDFFLAKNINKTEVPVTYNFTQALLDWIAEVKEIAIFQLLCSLVQDGLLQLEEAANHSHMLVEDFRTNMLQIEKIKMKEPHPAWTGVQEWMNDEKEVGIFQTLSSLVQDGLLQLEEAAKRSQMSVEDFRARMEQTDL